MKSKAKPAKGSARTKRFDVGGTVGALAGLGTLAYLMSRKKKGADGAESGGMSKDPNAPSVADRLKDKGDTTTKVDDAGRQRAMAASMGRPELVPEGADRDTLYESDKALVRTDGGKTTPVAKKKPAPPPAAKPKTGQGSSTTTGVDAGIAAGNKKKDVVTSVKDRGATTLEKGTGTKTEAKAKPSKYTTPGDPSKKEATSKAGVVFGGSTVRSDKDKMAERAREVQRRREEEMKSRYKKGGAVKKYAAGGSVKASSMGTVKQAKPSMGSASKRADGIAQRGKTRGKVC
jgi:hypothetical protein